MRAGGRPVTTPAGQTTPAAHRPRHRHSPRVRHRAREQGIDPDAVHGTGPGGRVTPADLAQAGLALAGLAVAAQRAQSTAVPDQSPGPPDEPAPARYATAEYATATVDLDVTGNVATRSKMLAAVAVHALGALRRHSAVTDVVFQLQDGTVGVAAAHDLSCAAVGERVAARRSVPTGRAVRVVDGDGLTDVAVPPAEGDLVVLGVGSRVTALAAVPGIPGGFGLRALVRVSVTWGATGPDLAAVVDLAGELGRRLDAGVDA